MKQYSRGTPQQFQEMLRNKIESLGGAVEACDNATGDELKDQINSAIEPGDKDTRERYLHDLYVDVHAALSPLVQDITWDTDESYIYLTVQVDADRLWEYRVPLEDLTFDFSDMEHDVNYIVETVQWNLDHPEDTIDEI